LVPSAKATQATPRPQVGPSGTAGSDLRPYSGGWPGGSLNHMFVAHELMLDIGSRTAQARLANLARGPGLSGSSLAAYHGGLAGLSRVGPLGELPGASKLVRVRLLDPVYRGESMRLGLRWEAAGVTGALFPALDADISLTPAGAQKTRLALAGVYRPPLGRFGAGLDRVILNQVATATIRTLLHSVADAIASPAPAAELQAGTACGPVLRPVIEPEALS
jgi:hypothetical protein